MQTQKIAKALSISAQINNDIDVKTKCHNIFLSWDMTVVS